MPDSILYTEECFVILQEDQPEQFLSLEELREKLKGILLSHQEDLPPDLAKFASIQEQVQHLIDTACEFDVGEGKYLQWYVTRLEK